MMRQSIVLPEKLPRVRFGYTAEPQVRGRNRVLVALDGSAVAERALPMALALAHRWRSPLRLVHVRNPVAEAFKMDLCLIDDGKSLRAHTRPSAYLSGLTDSLRATEALTIHSDVVAGTSIGNTLRSMSENDAGLLVMARKQSSTLDRFWNGSVTDSLIGQLSAPLLVIPAEPSPSNCQGFEKFSGFGRMLVYFDGADTSKGVLEYAAAMAAEDAFCQLLRVLPLSSLYTGGFRRPHSSEPRSQAWRELSDANDKLEESGIVCQPRLIFDGQNAGSLVVEQARAMRAQIIVVAAQQPLLPWWLKESVAQYVAYHADVPVLIAPTTGRTVPQSAVSHFDIDWN